MSASPEPLPPLATRLDGVYLVALAAAALALGGRPRGTARELRIHSSALVRRMPLVPGEVRVAGPLGESVLEVDPGGGVRFVASPCPGQLCIRLGRATGAGAALACIPNQVVVELFGGTAPSLDGVTR